jgi:alcohol dehydrogenase (cytochrome c)
MKHEALGMTALCGSMLLCAQLVQAAPAPATGSANAGVYTAAQADHGRALYGEHCANCHGTDLEGGVAPALTGPEFSARWSSATRTVDDLFYILRTAMPRPAVGSLADDEYVDVLAYLLSRNGVSAGVSSLTGDSGVLGAIRLAAATGGAASADRPPKRQLILAQDGIVPAGTGPSAQDLARGTVDGDWLHHTGSYRGTRYSPLAQINRHNVSRLQVACLYQIGGSETFVSGPLVHAGTMYVTTSRVTAAVDAATCRERWRHEWEPQDDPLWSNQRGVAIKDGYVVRGTADGYLFALDAADGRLLWARQVAYPAAGETITMPPMIFENTVIIGPAGSENNVRGWVGAFSLKDGSPLWRFNTVPDDGEPGAETWGNRELYPMGGGGVWSPMSLDLEREELYVPVTNPAPDFSAHVRPGANLYTNSIIALDVRSGALRWYNQLIPRDDKDWDVTQVSPLYETTVAGRPRSLVTTAGKDGVVRVLDRNGGEQLFETRLGVRVNDDKPITADGVRYCPGVLGGVQWNGPAYDPEGNMLYVPMVNWCTTATLEQEVRFIPGELYLGAAIELDDKEDTSGSLSAIDAATGKIRWQYDSPRPMVSAVVTTAGGIVMTGELTGDLLAFDARSGEELYRFNTGGSMAGGVITYSAGGVQHVAAATGKGSAWFGGQGAPTVIVFRL